MEMPGSTDASAEPKRPDDGGDAGDDRLSALPDDLLRAILSRLKAQQTVQTCVLSTRWRHLWRTVPRLDIGREHASHRIDDFTANLLRRHDFTILQELRLHGATVIVGDGWLRRDIGRDAWPRGLKRLHLSGLFLDLNDLASHISSSGCPALEEVELQQCWFFLSGNTKIASSSLKTLVINGNYTDTADEDDDSDEVFRLIIDAPALVVLRLGGEAHHIVDTTQPHNMPSLIDASIKLCCFDEMNHHLGILGALSNVTTLYLSHLDVTLLLDESHAYLPPFKFENLRTLFLDECRISDDFLGLRQYLCNSPNLQKLSLCLCKVSDFQTTEEVKQRRQSYSQDLVHFKCKNLRLTELIYRDGHKASYSQDLEGSALFMFFIGMGKNLPSNKIELFQLLK